jgi:hypothetical protein
MVAVSFKFFICITGLHNKKHMVRMEPGLHSKRKNDTLSLFPKLFLVNFFLFFKVSITRLTIYLGDYSLDFLAMWTLPPPLPPMLYSHGCISLTHEQLGQITDHALLTIEQFSTNFRGHGWHRPDTCTVSSELYAAIHISLKGLGGPLKAPPDA